MNTKISVLAASSVLIMALLACNMPSGSNSNDQQNGLALTITAQTLIIQGSTDQAAIKHDDSQISQIIDTPTPTPTNTSTPDVPMVSVSTTTNCRTGPSTDYDIVSSLGVGQTAEVVGKYSGGNYWVIKTPGGAGNCWLWGQYATISGNSAKLPEMIPPPAPPTAVPTSTPTPTSKYQIIKPIKTFILLVPMATPTSKYKIIKPNKTFIFIQP
jgi:uncharacterized protein YgiM (DUF1202 family)